MACLKLPSVEALATSLKHVTPVNSVICCNVSRFHYVVQPLHFGLSFHRSPIFSPTGLTPWTSVRFSQLFDAR